MAHIQILVSAVSAEFGSYRDALRHYLSRPNASVAVQEDFIVTGTETLDMLDEYIRKCHAVIHVVGDMTGALALGPSLTMLCRRYPDLAEKLPPLAPFLQPDAPALSYTQWEAWLALFHAKPLIIATPEDGAPRSARYALRTEQRTAQRAHLQRLAQVERYPGVRFASPERLAVEVLRSRLFDILSAGGPTRRVVHLPYPSLGDLFKGRALMMDELRTGLTNATAIPASAIVGKAVHGLGGVGKTRLAVEFAWRHIDDYTALLFVEADSRETLQRNLAALCAPSLLDLPQYKATEEVAQATAALNWLQRNRGWLLLVDSVDTEAAAAAVEALLPRLSGGHVLITGRMSNWSGGVKTLPLDVLQPSAAVDFLLARTATRRRNQADDADQAHALAEEMGSLALALEQAGAYIAQSRLSLGSYLELWRSQRDKVLAWYDPRLMQYPRSFAVTWQTSFDQLSEPARRLLGRLAWLAPAPIPESMLDVAAQDDAYAALVELESFSLVTRAAAVSSFTVHRLVQMVTRSNAEIAVLTDALSWVDAAFVGRTQETHDWPTLDPLLPHARTVARHADEAGIAAPTARLMSRSAGLLFAKGLYAEAEPLLRRELSIVEHSFGSQHPEVANSIFNLVMLLSDMDRIADVERLARRALAIDERSFGAEHPNVARHLNQLGSVLSNTNRLAEAEPILRRALVIYVERFGAERREVAIVLNNLAGLLNQTNRLAEAEPLIRQALIINEKNYGAEHPHVAVGLGNLAILLQDTNRLAEAEPLARQALNINEKNFGAQHPRVADSLNQLAALLTLTNRLAEAERLMRRALTIYIETFGAEHSKVAECLGNLCVVLMDTNRLAEAEPLARQALAVNERVFGAKHPDVAFALDHLAQLLTVTNRVAEAEPLMRRALAICVASLGADHPKSKAVKRNYALLLTKIGRGEKLRDQS